MRPSFAARTDALPHARIPISETQDLDALDRGAAVVLGVLPLPDATMTLKS